MAKIEYLSTHSLKVYEETVLKQFEVQQKKQFRKRLLCYTFTIFLSITVVVSVIYTLASLGV